MQGLGHEGLQASVGQLELISKVSAFASWANLGSHSASCKLCGPTRQSRAAASCVLYGPMRAKCPNIIVHPAAHCVLDGPMRADCPNITVHETGPRKGLGMRASRPLWANPSSSARTVHPHHGPTSAASLLAANYVGPRDSLVQQPVVCLMGQCENIIVHPAAHCVLDGPMRANCPNIMVHETGPCKGLGTRASRPLWANSSSSARSVHSHHGPTSAAIPLAANYVGPRNSLVRQPAVCLMGQCELIAPILRCMKWAHTRAWARGPPGLCGPTRAHQQGQCIHFMGQPRQPVF